jgi:hypothetical protein
MQTSPAEISALPTAVLPAESSSSLIYQIATIAAALLLVASIALI